jgi:arylsulfatase A-like enzyme
VLNEKVFDWLASVRGQPFFLFVNYIDTHRPYNTTPRPGFLEKPAIRDGGELLDRLYEAVMPGSGPVPSGLAQAVVDQYDTSIANVDEQFGVLIDRLRMLGLYDRTMLIVTSDHGEFFGEHHLVEHSKDVYQEVIWTPLIIKNPDQTVARTVETLTSSMDIPGLILSQLPDELAAPHRQAFPGAPGNHPVITEIYYTRQKDLFHPVWGHRFQRIRTAIYDWPFKYIHSTDEHHELYRLDVDAEESRNLVEEEPQVATQLEQRLQALRRAQDPAREPVDLPPLSEEQIKRLKALGYIGK